MVDKDFPIPVKGSSHGNVWGHEKRDDRLWRMMDRVHTQFPLFNPVESVPSFIDKLHTSF